VKPALRRIWHLFGRWFPWIALVGVTIGIVLAVRGQWDAITTLDWEHAWRVVLVAAVLFGVAPIAQATTSWIILRLLGASAPFGESMAIWAHAYVLRYAPSGALAVVYRVRQRERVGATRDQIFVSEAYENLCSMTAGACAFLVGFLVIATPPPWLGLVVALPVLVVAFAMRPRFLGVWAQKALRRIGVDTPILRGRHVVLVVLVNLAAWPCTGLAFLLLANGLSDEPSPGLAWAIASYSVGYLVGFVVPFLPGGLGAREGTLVATLAPRYGAGAATGIALASRLAATLGEAAAVGAIWAVHLTVRRFRAEGRPRRAGPSESG